MRILTTLAVLATLALGIAVEAQAQRNCSTTCQYRNGQQECFTHCQNW